MAAPIRCRQRPQCAAEKIKQLARDNGIMLVENSPSRRRSTRALKSEIQFGKPLQGSRRDSGPRVPGSGRGTPNEAERRSRNASGKDEQHSVVQLRSWDGTIMEKIAALLRKTGDWIAPMQRSQWSLSCLVPLPSFMLDLMLTSALRRRLLVLLRHSDSSPRSILGVPSLCFCLRCFVVARPGQHPPHPAPCNEAHRRRQVIEAFASFGRRHYIVGFVLFLAFRHSVSCYSHGAVRTAEVTARFTLDAMPGKQRRLTPI